MSRGIVELLRADGSISVNKRLIQHVGLVEAVIYSELLSRYCYFRDRGKLRKGWFYNTMEDLERGAGVSKRYQMSSIKKLQLMGLLEMEVKGVPATRHFRFTDQNLENLAALFQDQPQQEGQRSPEMLLIESFQAAGADVEVNDELQAQVREAIEQGMQQKGQPVKFTDY